MEARLAPLEAPYPPDIERALDRLMGGSGLDPLLLFRVVANNPAILERLRSTGTYLLNFGTLDPLEREIVIHRTCARAGAEYEWGVHVALFGRRLGLDDAQIRSTVAGGADDPAWEARHATLIRLADELYDSNTVSDDLWKEIEAGWTPAQIVELVALAGQYRMISYMVNAFRLAPEAFAERF